MPSIIRGFRRTPPSSNASSATSLELPHAFSEAMHFTSRSMKRLSAVRSSSSPEFNHGINPHHHIQMGASSSSAVSTPKSSLDQMLGSALLELEIETPPMVCYGAPADSSGALMSGILNLNVFTDEIQLAKLEMIFRQVLVFKKPVNANCPDCARKVTNLQTWKLVSEVSPARKGEHCYPFSYHFPGHLPATCDNTLSSIRYELVACATTTDGEKFKLRRDIRVSRSILEEQDRHSIRIFPPTSLTANLTLPPVVHHGADFPVEMRLDGIANSENKTRWKVRKMSWKIDEVCKTVSPACKVHSERLGGEGKGILHEDSRTIAGAEVKNGWKTDFEHEGKGKVEVEFQAGIPAGLPASNDVQYAEGNVQVTHTLIVEMIVAEETVGKGKVATPTGAARVLRMNFNLVVTDHSGLGISWVEECPPLYTDVPKSPPTYATQQALYFDLPPSFESIEASST